MKKINYWKCPMLYPAEFNSSEAICPNCGHKMTKIIFDKVIVDNGEKVDVFICKFGLDKLKKVNC